ncbi:STY0301 family protein [Legionella jordanis]|uniref:Uncharacterized protein n=1 Tax=Legionella jordanis TaxID=456 RepID=A0A0W0VBC1_9GAMM|nr:STY0301 family protein [Legionella jordanis]KTD17406.1 hypothetical protein Ljor_1712 [Legionella jordanis]RMX01829.1 hypothetical protein EAW55_09995 [Legionella jordanis]RMX15493.1 hypothetical protein EAS68_12455 [Legionella jordanis]VEH11573.1 Uncharacterised protein [Legionella jordanis]HAT8714647.1 hypothetical protein [Legionella jordanis]
MKIISHGAFILGLCQIFSFPAACAAGLPCPKEIDTRQILLHNIPGWQSYSAASNQKNYLNRLTFYSGHPKEQASLAPDNESSKSKILQWSFNDEEIWIACGYAETNIELIRKLEKPAHQCKVSYNTADLPISMNCR